MVLTTLLVYINFMTRVDTIETYTALPKTVSFSIYEWLIIVVMYFYTSWEFWLNQNYKIALVLLLPHAALNGFQMLYKDEFYTNDYYSVMPTTLGHIFSLVSSLWFTITYLTIKGGKKNIVYAVLVGLVYYAFDSMITSSALFSYYTYNGSLSIRSVLPFIGHFILGFTYYYILNAYSTWQKFKTSISVRFKQRPISRLGFILPFIILYSILAVGGLSFFTPVSKHFIRLPNYNPYYTLVLLLGYAALLILLLHTLSNLVFQKFNSIKQAVGIPYIALFIPVVNIFALLWLNRKTREYNKGLAIAPSIKSEKLAREDYKRAMLIFHGIGMIISILINVNGRMADEDLLFLVISNTITFSLLIGLYYKKAFWIAFVILITLSFAINLLAAPQHLALASFFAGLCMVYLYTQSFHYPLQPPAVTAAPQTTEQ